MYNILAGLKDYFRRQEIVTDNMIFRLHYIFTTVLLITFSLLVTATQYVGSPIQCINDNDVPIHVINTYCWISTTFTIPKAFMREIGQDVPHPGKVFPRFQVKVPVVDVLFFRNRYWRRCP